MQSQDLTSNFLKTFGKSKEDIQCYFGPGRVNLIGEHTDYNNGFVLPCALSFGTYLALRKTRDNVLRFHSSNFEFTAELPLQKEYIKSGSDWINYPMGVIRMFQLRGMETGGLEFYYSGNIPPAAGLSSSASIEMVTAFALNDLYGWGLNVMDLIHLSKKAENEFVGVNCGIMDQFAVGQGKKDSAIFLNCGTLSFQHVRALLPGYQLVIANTNKKRGLADSKYNERVAECARAVEYMKPATGKNSLGEYGMEDLGANAHLIKENTVLRRARHVISEDRRVLEAVKALFNGDLDQFGMLLVQSHQSLHYDYEVTGFELDSLVEASLQQEGVLGSRMTGAGFGGCTVSFVRTEMVKSFKSEVAKVYREKTGLNAEFYLPEIGDGVKRLG